MQICQAKIKGGKSDTVRNLMLDSGSDRSYACSNLIKVINPLLLSHVNVAFNSFNGENTSKPQLRAVYEVSVITTSGEYTRMKVIEVPKICKPLKIKALPQEILQKFRCVKLNSPYVNNPTEETITIDLLIGIDNYWSIVMDSPHL